MSDTTNKQQSQSYENGRNDGWAAESSGIANVTTLNDPDYNQGVKDGQTLAQSGYAANGTRQVS